MLCRRSTLSSVILPRASRFEVLTTAIATWGARGESTVRPRLVRVRHTYSEWAFGTSGLLRTVRAWAALRRAER